MLPKSQVMKGKKKELWDPTDGTEESRRQKYCTYEIFFPGLKRYNICLSIDWIHQKSIALRKIKVKKSHFSTAAKIIEFVMNLSCFKPKESSSTMCIA